MSLLIEHLSHAYGGVMALRDITARAERGHVIAVLGPNAAGKSTLLRCIIGALRPTSGRVLLDDRAVHRLSPRALAGRLAYVPQRSIVSAAFSARQVIELGRFALAPSPRRIDEAIEQLDLSALAHRPYRELSVGQQQRVTLARAFAQLPRDGLLVLDEPVSAMDLRHAGDVYRLLRTQARGGASVIMAMHDLPLAAAVADDVWLLNAGLLVAAGSACEVLSGERLERVFGVKFEWYTDGLGKPRLLPALPAESAGA